MGMLMESLSTRIAGAPLLIGAADGTIGDAFALSIVGIGVVFASLIVLFLIVWGMSTLMPATEQVPVAKRTSGKGASVDGGIDATTLAIIAAAATIAVGQPVKVKDVRPVE